MDDALVVRRFERVDDLFRDLQGFRQFERTSCEAIGQRPAFDQFEDEVLGAIELLEAVYACDVRVIEGSEQLRLAFEARITLRIVREGRRKALDGDIPIKAGIAGAIDLAHPAGAECRFDLVRAEASPGLYVHGVAGLYAPKLGRSGGSSAVGSKDPTPRL